MRCFIALNLLPETKLKISRIINELKQKNLNNTIRFVDSRNLHLTLIFLGEIKEKNLSKIKQAIAKAAKNIPAFSLKTDKISAFPNINFPRVLYLKIIDEKNITKKIHKNLQAELASKNLIFDKKNYIPHLTIARLKTPSRLNLLKYYKNFEFVVNNIELMKSVLTAKGPKYETMYSINLINNIPIN